MIYTGFRIGEVFTILKENVHLDEGYIIGGIKTEAGKDRTSAVCRRRYPR
ncbi:MAG: hypothetical protein ACLVAU_11750 [Ruminococcus sp.]